MNALEVSIYPSAKSRGAYLGFTKATLQIRRLCQSEDSRGAYAGFKPALVHSSKYRGLRSFCISVRSQKNLSFFMTINPGTLLLAHTFFKEIKINSPQHNVCWFCLICLLYFSLIESLLYMLPYFEQQEKSFSGSRNLDWFQNKLLLHSTVFHTAVPTRDHKS